ncbi:MAG TPA: DUF1800 domain-containing protein [Sporichthya sp.]|nr:DUF1800 domain-containing protein [Sporichthya sp.]
MPAGDAFTVHLLRRTTFGFTPELIADVTGAGGPQQWLDQQLNPTAIADTTLTSVLARWPLAAADPPAVYAAMDFGNWDSMEDLVRATIARQLWSKRQLFEVMVDFWSNHLNITCPSSEVWATKAWDDANVIRKYALGRFEDMLQASVSSPAMLLYLNNAESRGDEPNENYARELLELHTVGVDAGYDHDDIVNAARALSGLSVWDPWNGGTAANYGTFRFISNWHYVGPVTVMGWSNANATRTGGVTVARSLVTYLAHHPATAARLARKLAVRFVSDNPPSALISRLAQVYLDNDTAIIPVLRALFTSAEFAASTGQKVRRPAEDLVAAWRATGVAPNLASTDPDGAIGGLRWALHELSNPPLGWGLPNGYPDVASEWTGTGLTLNRWNAHIATTARWWDEGVTWPDLAPYLLGPTPPTTRTALIDLLIARLLPGQQVSTAHRDALVAFLGAAGPIQNGDTTWLFPVLVAVVLDSPYWSVR